MQIIQEKGVQIDVGLWLVQLYSSYTAVNWQSDLSDHRSSSPSCRLQWSRVESSACVLDKESPRDFLVFDDFLNLKRNDYTGPFSHHSQDY